MKLQNKGFTLVELIVVITILAILGSIAFISLQGFSADARNSARSTEIAQLRDKVNIGLTKGVNIKQMVADTTSSIADGTSTFGGKATGDVTATAGGEYSAGTPAYTVIDVNGQDFVDTKSGVAYPLGVTTLGGKRFQIAAIQEGDTNTAIITGNYTARNTANSNKTATVTAVSGSDDRTLTISAGTGVFKVGDLVNVNSTAAISGAKVTSISDDKATIKIDSGDATGATSITLAVDEVAGLIAEAGTNTTAVTDEGTDLPY